MPNQYEGQVNLDRFLHKLRRFTLLLKAITEDLKAMDSEITASILWEIDLLDKVDKTAMATKDVRDVVPRFDLRQRLGRLDKRWKELYADVGNFDIVNANTGNIKTVNSDTINNSGTINTDIINANTGNIKVINSTTINNSGTINTDIINANTGNIKVINSDTINNSGTITTDKIIANEGKFGEITVSRILGGKKLTINQDGATLGTYDGSADVTIDITSGDGGGGGSGVVPPTPPPPTDTAKCKILDAGFRAGLSCVNVPTGYTKDQCVLMVTPVRWDVDNEIGISFMIKHAPNPNFPMIPDPEPTFWEVISSVPFYYTVIEK